MLKITANLAIDLGASSGRIFEGNLVKGALKMREIHRFSNTIVQRDESLCWDLDELFAQIVAGLKQYSASVHIPASIGVDSWGVDFVLLDSNSKTIGLPYAYRDHRTDGIMSEVFEILPKRDIFKITGVQFQQFNTLFQLHTLKKLHPEYLSEAETLMFIPDYVNYLLTGEKTTEYTIASTSQLLNVKKRDWDDSLIGTITDKRGIFNPLTTSGEVIGKLSDSIQERTGLGASPVLTVPSHDTAAAVVAVPARGQNWAFISSGTWSLMGIETERPVLSAPALRYNFTNEGGVFGTYRFLKNLPGLWLLQEARENLRKEHSVENLIELADDSQPWRSIINPNDQRFFNPDNMVESIKQYCLETDQRTPHTSAQIARCIFDSIALQYWKVLGELCEVQKKPIHSIHIVGGGCQNEFLNQLCSDTTGLEVFAGPVEASALGNILMQKIALGEISSLEEGRQLIRKSLIIKLYSPRETRDIEKARQLYKNLVKQHD